MKNKILVFALPWLLCALPVLSQEIHRARPANKPPQRELHLQPAHEVKIDSFFVLVAEPEEKALPDSNILRAMHVGEITLALEEARRYAEVMQKIRAELLILDMLLQEDAYEKIDELMQAGLFDQVEKYSRAGPGQPTGPGDTLVVSFRSPDFPEGTEAYARRYLEKQGVAYPDSLGASFLNAYPSLMEKMHLEFRSWIYTEMQIDLLPEFQQDHVRYAEYLLELIRVLLDDYQVIGSSFADYSALENAQTYEDIEELIHVRYEFLMYCYEAFSNEYGE